MHTATAGELWVISNLHGDFVAAMPPTGFGLAYIGEYTENGVPRNGSTAGQRRYGWLGAEQRSSDTPGGLLLMGRRVYAPGSGRFLSTDPVYGGSDNAYEYCSGDAINCADVSGEMTCKRVERSLKRVRWVPLTVSFRYRVSCSMRDWEVNALAAMTTFWGVVWGLLGVFAGGIAGFAVGGPYGAFMGVVVGGLVSFAAGVVGALIIAAAWWAYETYDARCERKGLWFTAGIRGQVFAAWPRPRFWAVPYGFSIGCNTRKA